MTADLDEENSGLLQFLYACPVGLVEFDRRGTVGMLNPMAMQLLLPIAKAGEIANFLSIMSHYAPELRNLIDDFRVKQGTICSNHRIFLGATRGPESLAPQVLACTLVRLDFDRYMATLNDVSREVAQERQLRQAETWFASLLSGINDFAVLSLDVDGRIDRTNPSVLRQTGFSDDLLLGKSLDCFDDPDAARDNVSTRERIAIVRADGWHLHEGWHRRADQERYWCQSLIAARAEDNPGGSGVSGYTVVLRDVTHQEHDTVDLRRLLTTDHLTGARNRAHFFEAAETERLRRERHGGPLALIAMDVDHFKRINDTQGHLVGDGALQALAAACMGELRPTDVFARMGGEEFVVLSPATDLDGAVRLAERMRAAVGVLVVDTPQGPLHVTASFGCAVMGDAVQSISTLLEAADKALYEAKRAGRDRVVPSASRQAAA